MYHRKAKIKQHSPLRSKIEKIRVINTTGSQRDDRGSQSDKEILSYVAAFVEEVSEIPPLQPFSLRTREDAQKALGMLEKVQAELEAYLRRGRALMRILAERQDMKMH